MKGCKRDSVLVTQDHLCVDNIKAAAGSLLDNQLALIFIGALLVLGVLSFIAARPANSRPLRDDNVNYQLGRINDRLDRM